MLKRLLRWLKPPTVTHRPAPAPKGRRGPAVTTTQTHKTLEINLFNLWRTPPAHRVQAAGARTRARQRVPPAPTQAQGRRATRDDHALVRAIQRERARLEAERTKLEAAQAQAGTPVVVEGEKVADKPVRVKSHTKQDGTHVKRHTRSAPESEG